MGTEFVRKTCCECQEKPVQECQENACREDIVLRGWTEVNALIGYSAFKTGSILESLKEPFKNNHKPKAAFMCLAGPRKLYCGKHAR